MGQAGYRAGIDSVRIISMPVHLCCRKRWLETMEPEGEATKGTNLNVKNILYAIIGVIVIATVIILVAKFAFNVDLVNFDQLFGAKISKQELIRLQK